ncbi:hypothetical protein ANANG_G00109790 [Anguilla anguilla]|uniref:Uncharacterized protein n=1 Tax=Anguilla anguilla TaxID=7936 RepID=A0A9D3MN85_ANGAN|nr:hypothetical protein ANANG_G00109790 [Anguilla anguilla]
MSANRMIHWTLPLIVLFLPVVAGDLTINFNKNTSEISLKVFHDIAIIDSPKGKLSCKWGNVSCYVECANVNVSGNCTANKSLTLTLTLTEDEISAYNGSDAFNITAGSLDCEITKCLGKIHSGLY